MALNTTFSITGIFSSFDTCPYISCCYYYNCRLFFSNLPMRQTTTFGHFYHIAISTVIDCLMKSHTTFHSTYGLSRCLAVPLAAAFLAICGVAFSVQFVISDPTQFSPDHRYQYRHPDNQCHNQHLAQKVRYGFPPAVAFYFSATRAIISLKNLYCPTR